MKTIYLLITLIFVVSIIGCTQEEQSAGTGALIGAGVGAIIGHQSGEAKEGALIGGVVGGLAGYGYGKMKQKQKAEGQVEKYVECPSCNTTLELDPAAKAGDDVRCLKCGTEFELR